MTQIQGLGRKTDPGILQGLHQSQDRTAVWQGVSTVTTLVS